MNYWKECLECALDAHAPGILTPEQITAIAKEIEFGAQMESESSGRLCIPNPLESELKKAQARSEREKKESEQRLSLLEKSYSNRIGYRGDDLEFDYRDGGVQIRERML